MPTLLLAACAAGAADPPGFTQLVVGDDHVCGLYADGMAACWGANDEGQTDVPEGVRFRWLAAGAQFSCGLRLDGTVVCWGRDAAGWHVYACDSGPCVMVSAAREHVCALAEDGAASCWEYLGPGGLLPPEGHRYAAVDVGHDYACGLTLDRDLECWGQNAYRQGERRRGPFTALSLGHRHLCVVRADGGGLCQGLSDHDRQPSDAAFTQIVAGEWYSCGLHETGTVECWGGDGDAPAGPFAALSAGPQQVCGLRPAGEAVCWRMMRHPLPGRLTPAFEGRTFDQPVELLPWPGGGLAVVERRGVVTVHAPEGPPHLALDLSGRTITRAHLGLLGATLDPEFNARPYLYVWYSWHGGDRTLINGRLSRFPVVDGRVDAESELVLLEVPGQQRTHSGGGLRFGPDGMLYLGIGDYELDEELAQDLGSLRGAILRIDVRGASAERPYRVPDDNPLVAMPDARPEIWAWGLRNPYRMEFGSEGRLWVADVGTWLQEEVSLVTPGANLGWPVFEGTHCLRDERTCAELAGATVPAVTYRKDDLGCAIIGGVHAPSIDAFLFGDYCSGRIWALEEDGETGWSMREIARADQQITAFGRDADGEVYVLTQDGPILRLETPP